MLISEQKPMEEILSYLSGEEKVFIVGCKGCAEGCQTGGEQQAVRRALWQTRAPRITSD